MKLTVYADGASRGNPGPSAIGASILDPAGVELAVVSRTIGPGTNNRAEYMAAIEGVRAAARLGATAIDLRMDSELVIRQLSGRYQLKNAALKPLYTTLLREIEAIGPLNLTHVPREKNARADALANAALDGRPVDDPPSPPPPPSTPALRIRPNPPSPPPRPAPTPPAAVAPPAGIRYVPFLPEHLPAILAICEEEDWKSVTADPARLAAALTAPGVRTLVALAGDTPVGFAQGQGDGHLTAHLSLIAVLTPHRRHGIGAELVRQVFALLRGQHMDLVAFNESHGFFDYFEHRKYPGFRIYPERPRDNPG